MYYVLHLCSNFPLIISLQLSCHFIVESLNYKKYCDRLFIIGTIHDNIVKHYYGNNVMQVFYFAPPPITANVFNFIYFLTASEQK